MKKIIEVRLEKPARSSGADRYQGELDLKPWLVYIPQSVSRKATQIRKVLTITIEDKDQ